MENNQDLQLEEEITSPASEAELSILREMMKAGLMYGHKKSKTNPKFKRYIFTNRNGVEVIDLGQTLTALDSVIEFLKNQIKEGKLVLLVATQSAAKEAMQNFAKKFNFCYINEHWIGGLLTNVKVLSQRIEHFKKTQADLDRGAFEKYTKKERVLINRNINRMKKMFTGLENLTRLPDIIFTIDPCLKGHMTAIREAKRIKIPIVAILDSDDDPDLIDYLIPSNDHTKTSVDWIINRISEGLSA